MTPARRRVLISAAIAVVVLVGAYLLLSIRSGSTAKAGTTVAGVDIGGMTQAEAAAALHTALDPVVEQKLKVQVLETSVKVDPTEAGLSLDADASVAPAFGHSWNPLDLVGSLFGGQELPPVVDADPVLLGQELDMLSSVIDNPPVEPTIRVKKGTATVTEGKPGRALDRGALKAALIAALVESRQVIQAEVISAEPTVTRDAAESALSLADTAMSAPVEVTAGTVTATIPGRAVGRALRFTAVDGTLEPSLEGAKLHRAIAKELAPIETPGRDATFKIRKGVPKVVKSKVGTGISDEDLAAAVLPVIDKPAGQRNVTVAVTTRQPAFTTEQAQALGIKDRLSTFTQNYPYAAYRSQNIGQAAKRINGTLLMPGDTFSLNDTIKERTEANGYTVGYVVGPGGIFAEDLGGGVSTSATATWTAAFYAGLERVQTVAHSIYISRYKPGLEATVAWGIFDLKFRNDTGNAVFITAGTTPTSITVSMWGTKVYDKIEAEFGPRENVVKYKKVYDTSKQCHGQGGVDGFTITVDRVFYKDGKEVKREPITTRYKPAPEVICGEKPNKKKNKKNADANGVPASDASNDPSAFPSASPTDSPTAKPGGKKGGSPSPTPAPPTDSGGGDVFSN